MCDLDSKVKVIGKKAGICDGVPSTAALVDVFMYILPTHQSKQRCPYNIAYMHVGKNIGTGMLVLLTSVNLLGFKSQEIPTFSSYIYWFTRNYKD